MNAAALRRIAPAAPADAEAHSLPAWIYRGPGSTRCGQRLWSYFKLWPNTAFDLYPDQIDFMQFLPVSPTDTMIREVVYVHPDSRREMRAARYLNWRINRRISHEDKALIERVQSGMASSSYLSGPRGWSHG